MKKIIISLTLVFITFSVIAQEKSTVNNQKLFLILSGGPSLPVGSFSSKDVDANTKAGLATIGYNINLNSGYHFTDRFGIATSRAGDELHPDVAWAKLKSLVEGARIATARLWR